MPDATLAQYKAFVNHLLPIAGLDHSTVIPNINRSTLITAGYRLPNPITFTTLTDKHPQIKLSSINDGNPVGPGDTINICIQSDSPSLQHDVVVYNQAGTEVGRQTITTWTPPNSAPATGCAKITIPGPNPGYFQAIVEMESGTSVTSIGQISTFPPHGIIRRFLEAFQYLFTAKIPLQVPPLSYKG